jgi:DNA-binding beta-propeller fold protein YncE
VLAVWGGPAAGSGPGQFRQPCGVAAGRDGSIYVADTWNHRIVKLDRNGQFQLEWRDEDQGFWGPRAVAVAPNGTVFVADTGNKRILAYESTGRRLFDFGGEGSEPGKLIEPVGLTIDEATGTLYVADTGNHRIQAFDLEGRFRSILPVFGWQEFYTEPYLAWHAGMLWATDSFNRRINAYDSRGTLLRSIDGAGGSLLLSRPTGIAVASDGRVYVSDVAGSFVAVLDEAKPPG